MTQVLFLKEYFCKHLTNIVKHDTSLFVFEGILMQSFTNIEKHDTILFLKEYLRTIQEPDTAMMWAMWAGSRVYNPNGFPEYPNGYNLRHEKLFIIAEAIITLIEGLKVQCPAAPTAFQIILYHRYDSCNYIVS